MIFWIDARKKLIKLNMLSWQKVLKKGRMDGTYFKVINTSTITCPQYCPTWRNENHFLKQ